MSDLQIIKKKPNRSLPLKVENVLADVLSGLKEKDIAVKYNTTAQVVNNFIHRHELLKQRIDDFKNKRADILAFKQKQVIEHLTPKKMKDASLRDLGTTFVNLSHAERLERGQATGIIDIYQTDIELANVSKRIQKLKKELGEGAEEVVPIPVEKTS